jgi:hypothetical protein
MRASCTGGVFMTLDGYGFYDDRGHRATLHRS